MAPSPQKKKQKTYRKFDGCAKAIRDGVLSACAKSYLQHLEENGGKCKRGFVKSLVDEAKQSAPTYGISRDDIKNEVRRLKKSESEARPTQDDAPAGDVAEEATRVSPLHFFADIAAEAAPTTTAATNVDEAPGDPSPSMTSAGVAAVAASDSAPPAAGVAVSDSASDSSPPAAGVAVSDSASAGSSSSDSSSSGDGECDSTAIASTSSGAARSSVNRGGRPVGSSKENKRKAELNRKKAVNWVIAEMWKQRQKLIEAQPNEKRIRFDKPVRQQLVAQAKEKFDIREAFDVPKQTISNRFRKKRLEVWQPGFISPLIHVEVLLIAQLIVAWSLKCPLSVRASIALMNSMIENTPVAERVIAWKMKDGIYNPDEDLVGRAWWRGFKRRNPELEQKAPRNFERNRADHCTYSAFEKMFNQVEALLIQSGNAKKSERPTHQDRHGNVVDDVTLAFGLMVTLIFLRACNAFLFDETGCKTNGKEDGKKGGEKQVVPAGEIPKLLVGIRHSHFTVVPVSDFNGRLRFIVVIFAAKKLDPLWTHGVDVFAELDNSGPLSNFGPGKRYPGLNLVHPDGEEVPTMFAASKKGSMTSPILRDMYAAMDRLGIAKRGVDENGIRYVPASLIDGHVSRMGEDFLTYVCNEETKWVSMLGAPYGTGLWQFHDDKRQNGSFKTALTEAKRKFIAKKQAKGLPAEVLPQEIVIVVQAAVEKSFLVESFGRSTLAERGWNPFNRNPLDHSEILVTAPEDVRKERSSILLDRGIASSQQARAHPLEQNLLESGSGRIAGGEAASQAIAETAATLNYSGSTATHLMTLMQNQARRNEGVRRQNDENGAELTSDELKKRYKEARRMTAGMVFGEGNGHLGKEVRDEVVRRNQRRKEKAANVAASKKAALRNLQREVEDIRASMKQPNFKFTLKNLRPLIKWKRRPEDKALPSRKDDLLKRWEETKNRASPRVSPANSEAEDTDASVGSHEEDQFIFGPDEESEEEGEWDSEGDDDESEESEESEEEEEDEDGFD